MPRWHQAACPAEVSEERQQLPPGDSYTCITQKFSGGVELKQVAP